MNLKIFYFLNHLVGQSAATDKIIVFFAVYFGPIIVVVLSLYLLLGKKSYVKNVILLSKSLSSAFLSWIVASMVKYLLFVPRPFQVLADNKTLFLTGGYDSFPSGHAAFFFGLATTIFLKNKKMGTALYVCTILIVLGRVMAGVHYPLDILGGMMIGIFIPIILGRWFNLGLGLEKQQY